MTRSNKRIRRARRNRINPPSREQIEFIPSALNISVEEFASRLGVGKSTVYYWKTGEKIPTPRNSVQLWKFFGEVGEAYEEYLRNVKNFRENE